MGITVELTRLADGVVREYPMDIKFNEYIWADGNFSCDCNRELFFLRAADEDEPDETDCGDERFAVRIYSDGELVFDDHGTRRALGSAAGRDET